MVLFRGKDKLRVKLTATAASTLESVRKSLSPVADYVPSLLEVGLLTSALSTVGAAASRVAHLLRSGLLAVYCNVNLMSQVSSLPTREWSLPWRRLTWRHGSGDLIGHAGDLVSSDLGVGLR